MTKRGNRVHISDLLNECGWLSVHQLAVYHTVVMLHKTIQTGLPTFLSRMYVVDDNPRIHTRLSDLKLVKARRAQAPRSLMANYYST